MKYLVIWMPFITFKEVAPLLFNTWDEANTYAIWNRPDHAHSYILLEVEEDQVKFNNYFTVEPRKSV